MELLNMRHLKHMQDWKEWIPPGKRSRAYYCNSKSGRTKFHPFTDRYVYLPTIRYGTN